MRIYILITGLLIAFNGLAQQTTVNAVLGDTSWLLSHDALPGSGDTEQDRITTHLRYVLGKLKATEAEETETANRKIAIDLLEEYVAEAKYPSAFDYSPFRRPCFIDDEGTLCAVGYLIAHTAGLEEAERINSLYRYNYITEMEDAGLQAWQQSIGLSTKELATIQPAYGSPPEWVVYKDPRKEQYGLKNRYTDEVIAKPIYDSLVFRYHRPMYANLGGVLFTGLAQIDNQWGAINSRGEIVVPLEYDSIAWIMNKVGSRRVSIMQIDTGTKYLQAFTNQKARVFNHLGKEMFQLPKGKVAYWRKHLFIAEHNKSQRFWDSRTNRFVGNRYERIQPNSYNQPKGYLVFNSAYGFVSEPGKELIPCTYKSLQSIGDCWLAGNDEGNQLLSLNGQPIDIGPINWAEVYGFTDSSKLVIWKGNKRGIFDLETRQWLIEAEQDQIFPVHEGLIYVEKDGKKGYYNISGKVIVPTEYDNIRTVSDGYLVRKKGKMGLFKNANNWVFPLSYDSILIIENASLSAYALLENGIWKIRTADGTAVLEQEFTSFNRIQNQAYAVGIGNKLHFACLEGSALLIHTAMSIQSWSHGVQDLFIYEQNGKYGFWTTYKDNWMSEGRITDPIYDEVIDHGLRHRGALPVKYKGKYGLVNREGHFMVPATYQALDHAHISVLYFKGADGWYRYDYDRPLQVQTPRVNLLLDERNK